MTELNFDRNPVIKLLYGAFGRWKGEEQMTEHYITSKSNIISVAVHRKAHNFSHVAVQIRAHECHGRLEPYAVEKLLRT